MKKYLACCLIEKVDGTVFSSNILYKKEYFHEYKYHSILLLGDQTYGTAINGRDPPPPPRSKDNPLSTILVELGNRHAYMRPKALI